MTERKYTIVHIIDTLDAGGAERVLVTLCNLFHSKGHKVAVITTLRKGILADQLAPGIEVKELQRSSKWSLGAMARLVEWCKPFNVVHIHSSHNLRFVFLAAKLFYLRKQLFFHEHFGSIEIDERVHWHQKLIYPSITLIAVSRKIYDWALEKAKLSTEKVFLLPNSVPQSHIIYPQKQRSQLLKLLMVANFRPAKHMEFALKLVQALKQQQQVQLTLVGQPANKEYYAAIKEQIDVLQLNDVVSIRTDCTNVQDIMYEFDAAIHTAKSESGPLVLIEYMAQGLPFLTYKTGEVVYQIEEALPFCVIDNFEVDRWIQQLQALLQMPVTPLREQLYHQYNLHYSEEQYYQACLNIYQQTLEKK